MIGFIVNRSIPALCLILLISGCTGNIREQSAAGVAERITRNPTAHVQGFSWTAPDLSVSQYRTLFFGYDTLKYHLLAAENPAGHGNKVIQLFFQANYGGSVRHYELAQVVGQSTRSLHTQQHIAERCQLFNSLISSCLYQDQFILDLSVADLEQARSTGLNIALQSHAEHYESIDLPAAYIDGFLQAIGQP